MPTPQACRDAQITPQTFYRWRKEFGRTEAGPGQAAQRGGESEREAQALGGRTVFGETDPKGCSGGKLPNPEWRRTAVERACRLVGQWRATQRYEPMHRTDEDALTEAIIQLASEYGRYG